MVLAFHISIYFVKSNRHLGKNVAGSTGGDLERMPPRKSTEKRIAGQLLKEERKITNDVHGSPNPPAVSGNASPPDRPESNMVLETHI